MKYNTVLITPEELDALHNVTFDAMAGEHPDADLAYKWLAYVKGIVYSNWQDLPAGSHLKSAYADDVWSLDDSDLV